MPKIAVIGTPGGWSSELLADTVAASTGSRILVDMKKTRLDLTADRLLFNGEDLFEMDAVMIKKIGGRYSPDLLDRLEMLRFLEERGVPVFSSPGSIMRVLDRLSCTVTLTLAGIPMPPTMVTEDVDQALRAVRDFGEAVFKPLYTSKARGMTLVKEGPSARNEIEQYKKDHRILYIQKRIDLPEQDLGIVFLGGQYLTTYARRKTNASWDTTTRTGGKYAPYDPPRAIIELAHKSQSLFDLDFTCVDVAETKDGPMVFEVSAFGGFRGIQETSGLDAADLFLQHVLKRIGS